MMSGKFARSAFGAAAFSLAAAVATASLAQTTSPSFPAPSEALTSSLAALDASWDSSELAFTAATFATSNASGYGQYTARDSNSFSPTETITVYAEPIGYVFAETSVGHRHDIEVGFRLLNTTGQVLAQQDGFARFAGVTPSRKRELPTSLSFQFEGLPAGDYVLEALYTDKISNKSGTVTLPFTMTAAQ